MWRAWPLLALASANLAQSTEGPVFDAASLKKLESSSSFYQRLTGGPGTATPARVEMHYWVLDLMLKAFDKTRSEFVNTDKLPPDRYELEAVLPEGASNNAYQAMLRNLLIERFHLRYHTETRQLKHYELLVAPGGPKMKPSDSPPSGMASTQTRHAIEGGYVTWPLSVDSGFSGNGPRFPIQRVDASVAEFAAQFKNEWLDAPVDDKTGLDGKYDFRLRFTAAPNQESEASEPDLATAMRQQLGLILREIKSPAEVVVIDSIDKEPTPN